MYGGGFSTIPAYLADIFGTHHVGAIHGLLLTAWSTAGILGPVLVNYLREYQLSIGAPRDAAYNQTMYVLAGLLLVGLACDLLVRPVAQKYYMTDEEVAAEKKMSVSAVKHEEEDAHADFEDFVEEALDPEPAPASPRSADGSSSDSRFTLTAVLAWLAVSLPLAWGVWMTLQKALKLLQ
jgi:MFS family permease